MQIDVEKLRELAGAASALPWRYHAEDNIISAANIQRIISVSPRSTSSKGERTANAEYIVAACNAMPALLSTLAALREENARLVSAISEAIKTIETSPAIIDTVWVSTGLAETLVDHLAATLPPPSAEVKS
jgi:hypothetical protein